jgi:hypothetical protein
MLSRLISFVDAAGAGYGCIAVGADGAAAAFCTSGSGADLVLERAELSRGEGTLRADGEAGTLVLGLAARTTPLAFETGEASSVQLQSVGVSASLSPAGGSEHGFEGEGVSWVFEGEEGAGSLRTMWALEPSGLLAIFALRAAEAANHAAETIGAVRIAGDGTVRAFEEPLISTEYDGAGKQTRATLELWGGDGEGMAERGGGKRIAGGTAQAADGELEAARFDWSVGGSPALGAYEIFNAG